MSNIFTERNDSDRIPSMSAGSVDRQQPKHRDIPDSLLGSLHDLASNISIRGRHSHDIYYSLSRTINNFHHL